MKIGLLSDSITDTSTGIGYYAKNVIDSLLKTRNRNKYYFIDYEKKSFHKNNLVFIKNPFKIIRTYLWHSTLPLLLMNTDLDVVFNFTSCPHFIPYKQKEYFFVYDISWLFFPNLHPLGRIIFFKFLFLRSLRNSSYLVVDSKHAKQDLIKHLKISKEKIIISYPVIPKKKDPEKKPDFIKDKPFILFIGTLQPIKNIESIIMAFNKLKDDEKIPHKLIISGKRGWKYRSIFRLIEDSMYKEDIIVTGYIEEREKNYLYKNATFFIYPSFYEGFGLPIIEALSYGTPVIASNVSSIPEVAGKAALLVDPYNVPKIVEAMKKLVFNMKFRKKLIAEGYKQARKFTSPQLQELLKSLKN